MRNELAVSTFDINLSLKMKHALSRFKSLKKLQQMFFKGFNSCSFRLIVISTSVCGLASCFDMINRRMYVLGLAAAMAKALAA